MIILRHSLKNRIIFSTAKQMVQVILLTNKKELLIYTPIA